MTRTQKKLPGLPAVFNQPCDFLHPLSSLSFSLTRRAPARTGVKAYQPAFWTLPGMFLTSTAAAGSIGLINSIGNLGGFVGPKVMGKVETITGSYIGGIWFLAAMMAVAATIIFILFLGNGVKAAPLDYNRLNARRLAVK